jgi:hypothetical protein
MIDFEKLKQCIELAEKIDCKFSATIRVNCLEANLYQINYERLQDGLFHKHESYLDINACIYKLQELTQLKTKYKIGDRVYFMDLEGNIGCDPIMEIDLVADYKYCIQGERWYREDELYPTKSELIEAQIKYWSEMMWEDRKIQPAPFEGSIPIEKIQSAIDSLSSCCSVHTGTTEECPILLVSKINKCPDCNSEMADYAGLCEDNKWRTGCSKQCGYYHEISRDECVKECEHENDGEEYMHQRSHHYKCNKCGEFYR